LNLLRGSLLPFDLERCYASGSLIHLAVIVGLLIYGFVLSLGDRRLFSDPYEA
jgi:hypothetical protein